MPEWMILVLFGGMLLLMHIQSRRIDRVHTRISLTTELNGLRDPWRDASPPPQERNTR